MDFSKLTDYLDNIDKNLIPQCELIVYKNNEKVFEYFTAKPDIYEDEKKKNLYFLFSATKVITATAVMRLVQDGKLSLEDKVSKYFPEFATLYIEENGKLRKAENALTIKHLLSMQGGLTYNLGSLMEYAKANPDASTSDFVKKIAEIPLKFEPGTDYQYSLGHDVLAGVVEVVTGKKYFDYLNEIIFSPLNIKNISFGTTEEKIKNMHRQYSVDLRYYSAQNKVPACPYELGKNYQSGGAGLIADPQDYVKIIDCIASGKSKDGYTILNREYIDIMRQNHLCDKGLKTYSVEPRIGYGYGLGVRTLVNPEKAHSLSPAGEFGWDGAAGAYALIDVENKLSLFYEQHIFNCDYVYKNVHPAIRNLVYDGIK